MVLRDMLDARMQWFPDGEVAEKVKTLKQSNLFRILIWKRAKVIGCAMNCVKTRTRGCSVLA